MNPSDLLLGVVSQFITDPLSTECLRSNSGTQTRHKAIAPHWSSSYPEYLSADQDQVEQQRVVWSRLYSHRANLAKRLTSTRERYHAARQALNPGITQVESSHDPLYRDIFICDAGSQEFSELGYCHILDPSFPLSTYLPFHRSPISPLSLIKLPCVIHPFPFVLSPCTLFITRTRILG